MPFVVCRPWQGREGFALAFGEDAFLSGGEELAALFFVDGGVGFGEARGDLHGSGVMSWKIRLCDCGGGLRVFFAQVRTAHRLTVGQLALILSRRRLWLTAGPRPSVFGPTGMAAEASRFEEGWI